ncbi:hypothetical protein PTTG_03246 [Puccinia triticina 1-1 BBBD Race 1]|uniref:Chromatin modification-related protein n=1 Tax=Puccinia triticina (isolate 1-1 / race 1 (BBBD)) TaxID=630390 RepID=A0A180GAH9_PUCT1|nr:hypothetical protein PTTG_03246 [Puccinia triticina 1-1 BBBD Race 1]
MPPKSASSAAAAATTAKNQQPNNSNHRQTTTKPEHQPRQQQQQQQQAKQTGQESQRLAIEVFAESVHLVQGFADTLDAIPPSLTRSLSDLKELDAVLSTPLNQLHAGLDQLLGSLKQPQSITPEERLKLLRNMMADIERYKLGAQDKIRVANGTCESLSHHIRQLDTTTSLLISSLPPSLESKIPPSSFPTGYPKLTGSLRSKPIGGVWQNSNPSNLQQPSPPSIPTREFINFHQGSPRRQLNQHQHHHPHQQQQHHHTRPFDGHLPLPKRPRLGPSGLPYQPDDDPSPFRRDHPPAEMGSKLLDQHIYSQSMLDAHQRGIQPDDHHGAPPRPPGKMVAPQHPQHHSTPNPLHTALAAKLKRSFGLGEGEPEVEVWPPFATPPPGGLSGPKKRARKSKPAGGAGKQAQAAEEPSGSSTKPTTEPQGAIASTTTTEFASPSSHPTKPTTQVPTGSTSRKTTASGGVRQTTAGPAGKAEGSKPAGPGGGAPAKRAYTKRAGLASSTGGAPKKRGNPGKKAVVGGAGPGEGGGRKAGAGKEGGVRLEEVAEAGGKARQRKAAALHELADGGRGESKTEAGAETERVGGESAGEEASQVRGVKRGSGGPTRKRKETADAAGAGGDSSSEGSTSAKTYCVCKGSVYGERMVGCDNAACPIEWFHYQCAGLTEDPTGNWFCPDCRAQGFGSPECARGVGEEGGVARWMG